ncbi:hypothetical protein GJ496_004494 [Pomphorhynchus laevis]|nr:hypothetical protein GJ496_004494 [Pomphorhynchus laevis]
MCKNSQIVSYLSRYFSPVLHKQILKNNTSIQKLDPDEIEHRVKYLYEKCEMSLKAIAYMKHSLDLSIDEIKMRRVLLDRVGTNDGQPIIKRKHFFTKLDEQWLRKNSVPLSVEELEAFNNCYEFESTSIFSDENDSTTDIKELLKADINSHDDEHLINN